ncbi:MAG: hypothetical protein ACPIOQ_81195, partial [Promethearchaeia archaeon]
FPLCALLHSQRLARPELLARQSGLRASVKASQSSPAKAPERLQEKASRVCIASLAKVLMTTADYSHDVLASLPAASLGRSRARLRAGKRPLHPMRQGLQSRKSSQPAASQRLTPRGSRLLTDDRGHASPSASLSREGDSEVGVDLFFCGKFSTPPPLPFLLEETLSTGRSWRVMMDPFMVSLETCEQRSD